MGNFQYLSAILLALQASSVFGDVHTVVEQETVHVQVTYTPPVVIKTVIAGNGAQAPPNAVQPTPSANPEPASPVEEKAATKAAGGGTTPEAAQSTAAGAAQKSVSSTSDTCGRNVQKISLENQSGQNLIIGADAPWTVGNCGNIADGSTCTFCLDRGSTGGNLKVGYGVSNSRGTWIEGNWDYNSSLPLNVPQWATVDISFIPGYSVPIFCTSDLDTTQTKGWKTPLCDDAHCSNCNGGGGNWDGNSCVNPAGLDKDPQHLEWGPSPSFYSAAQNDAYCFPKADSLKYDVVAYGKAWSSASCIAYKQFKDGPASKRDMDETLVSRETDQGSSMLEVRKPTRHGAHGGARAHARGLKHFMT